MTRRIPLLTSVLFLVVLVVAACSGSGQQMDAPAQPAPNADGYTDISVQQLADMLSDKDFTLVNVHVPFAGDIPQTDVSIAYNQIDQELDRLPDKDAPIVLYCSSGNMSTQAAKILAKLGYTNVMELDGGFTAWANAGNELISR